MVHCRSLYLSNPEDQAITQLSLAPGFQVTTLRPSHPFTRSLTQQHRRGDERDTCLERLWHSQLRSKNMGGGI